MSVEVEQKFPCEDVDRVREQLIALGATVVGDAEHQDRYYNHPARDFAKTDEAFRLRSAGKRNFLTYKGPKLDRETKTRVEQEVRIADGPAAASTCDQIVRSLGFAPVAVVRKRRQSWEVAQAGARIEATIDDVAGVGSFVELEICIEGAEGDSAAVEAAKKAIAEFATRLNLHDSERSSYLELFLEASKN